MEFETLSNATRHYIIPPSHYHHHYNGSRDNAPTTITTTTTTTTTITMMAVGAAPPQATPLLLMTISYFKVVLSVWTEFFFIFNHFLINLNSVFNLFSELFIYRRNDEEKEKIDIKKVDRMNECDGIMVNLCRFLMEEYVIIVRYHKEKPRHTHFQLQPHLLVSTIPLPFDMSLSPISSSVSSTEWEYKMSYSSPLTISQEYAIREHAQTDEEFILPPLQFLTIVTQSQLSTPRDSRKNNRPFIANSPTGLRSQPILETLLYTTSFGLNGGCRLCDYKLAKAVSSFYHLKIDIIPYIVVIVLDVTSSRTTVSYDRLRTGSILYLYDDALKKMSKGFEQTILLETIQRVEWKEPGYQIYQLKVHLYSRMVEPFSILTDKAYVAILHTYILVITLLSYNSYVILGQEWDEKGVIYPPC